MYLHRQVQVINLNPLGVYTSEVCELVIVLCCGCLDPPKSVINSYDISIIMCVNMQYRVAMVLHVPLSNN